MKNISTSLKSLESLGWSLVSVLVRHFYEFVSIHNL